MIGSIHSQNIHAAEASLQQLGFVNDKQENVELGFHQQQPHSTDSFPLGFHHKQALAKLAKPDQLGFPHELAFSVSAQVGFHDKPAQPAAHQVRFHMNLRRLANGATSSSMTSAAQVSPSIVVIIIVLTVIFFLSAFLHLLIRWLARNPALIRRGARTGANTRSNNRIIALTALQGQLQQLFSIQDAGLERSLIEELPVFSFKAAMGGLKEGADCAICLCEFVGDDQLRLLPLCGHAFHTECIDTWLLSHSTCPLCRALLVPECWMPGMFQPLLSPEIGTTGDNDHQHIADTGVPALSGRFTGSGVPAGLSGRHFTGSSRRSSVGHVTIIAGTLASPLVDHNQSQLAAEPPLHLNPLIPTTRTDLAISDDTNFANPASSETSSVRGMTNSAAILATSYPEGVGRYAEIGKLYSTSEMEDRANHIPMKIANEGTCSANAKSFNASSSAITAMMDSGRLSYTSLGNQTDAQSETYNDLDGVSACGSERRVSVHLGKCRVVREQGKSTRKSKASRDASRSSYSKGSYEYVIDSSSNLEVIIPPVTPLNPHSKRFNDLLNLSHQNATSASAAAEFTSSGVHGPRDSVSKTLSPSWASASFRKIRIREYGGDDVDTSIDSMNAPLNTSLPSDKPASIDRWPVVGTPELPDSSAATSMRANVGSDASFSPEMVNQRLQELMVGSNGVSAEHETSKRAVSFRLPTPASHNVMNTRLKSSASRRALSESEAFAYWEPTITEQDLDQASGHDHRLFLNDNTGSHRSSSFAKRTMDWLVGWQKRMVHPDKSAQANTSRTYPS